MVSGTGRPCTDDRPNVMAILSLFCLFATLALEFNCIQFHARTMLTRLITDTIQSYNVENFKQMSLH